MDSLRRRGAPARAVAPSSRGLFGALAALGITCGAATAAAQEQPGLALSRFDPAPAGDRMFGAPSPYTAGHLTPHAMILADYAHNPLVLRRESDDENVGAVVGSQLLLHLNATLPLWNRLTINVSAPIALFQSGDDPIGGGATIPSPSGVEFGDIRLGARARLLGEYDDAFQLALGAYVWFPTGASGSFVSDETIRALPQAIVGGRFDRAVWSFSAGVEIRGAQEFLQVEQGTMLKWGGGIGFLVDSERRLQIGPEIGVAMVLREVSGRTFNAEALLDARYRILDDFEVGAGFGPGFTGGIGTPDVRGVAMVAYTPAHERPAPDRDHDGIADATDACIDVRGIVSADPKRNGCPGDQDRDGIFDTNDACPQVAGVASADPTKNGCPSNRDGDPIIDAEDACPDVVGIPDADPKKNGCPPDRDNDGVIDAQDACPAIPGIATEDPATNGCPPDTDRDAIINAKDACPEERGFADPDPEKHGCPKAVRVTQTQIVILQQVQFDTDKATIKDVSDPLLDEVAQVLTEHPEILKLEVQGHTDDRGAAKRNEELSQSRAESVVKALVKRGIAEDRLQAKGYGEDVPLNGNTTEAGRQNNRRVQFQIVQKAVKKAQ
jgi:outer membrane protein OmpA-like peptidoglycan-associated protein